MSTRRKGAKTTQPQRGSKAALESALTLLEQALACSSRGELARAEEKLLDLLRRHPGCMDGYLALARCQVARGALEQAAAVLREAARLQPDNVEVRLALGEVYFELGNAAAAADEFARLASLSPESSEAAYRSARTARALGRLDDALHAYRRALSLDPDDARAERGLGEALYELRRVDEAYAVFERALRLDPASAAAHQGLGRALLARGEPARARECFRKALQLDPAVPGAALGLARSQRFEDADEQDLVLLERLLKHPAISERGRSDLHFALGKALDDCGQFAQAFEHFRAGNGIVGRSVRLDWARYDRAVAGLVDTFCNDFFATRSGAGHASELPVFIVGMPRSGTTLVEQIIASHASVRGGGELPFVDELTRGLSGRLGSALRYPACATRLDGDTTVSLAAQYLSRVASLSPGVARVTDKMPANFYHLGFIATLFPRAHVVHCRREPLDLCLSIYCQQFEHGHEWAYDFADIAAFYRGYRRLTAHWREVLPLDVHEVDYERLVSNQEAASRVLVDYCGLPWDARCLRYFESQARVQTASDYQVRQPIYTGSVGRWRHYAPYLDELRELLGDDA